MIYNSRPLQSYKARGLTGSPGTPMKNGDQLICLFAEMENIEC